MLDRRTFLSAMGAAPLVLNAAAGPALAATDINAAIGSLEKKAGGRLGVAVLDLHTGRAFAHRGDERFPMCSVFKLSLAALMLHRAEKGQEQLDRRLRWTRADLIPNSPATTKAVATGLTIRELSRDTIIHSDNTAANVLLREVGGPAGMTRFWRQIGDPVTRLDGIETAMSASTPGDVRDTTSPRAMLATVRTLTLGDALSPASRKQLIDWLVANTTGDTRIRAGLPNGWVVGDKTGTGGHGTSNDVAVAWPPGRKPVFISTFLTGSKLEMKQRNAIIAEAARAVVAAGFGTAA